ncbi:MAG: hypothetical protein ACK52I_20770 [Pseudomonadota bacterium]|jgi:hypothetical protein
MSGFDWKSLVKNVAPVLGTALGGPMAGAATKFIAESWLGKPDASEQEVAEAVLSASPDKLIELRKLDNDFKIRMRELDINVYEIEVDDRKSARDLAKVNMTPQITLSVIYTVGYFACLWVFLTGAVTVAENLRTEFGMVLGVMTAAQIKIMDFWFGSSYGSKVKDAAKAAA